MSIVYNRVVVKLSGESLAGSKGFGFDFGAISYIVEEIKKIYELGVEVAIVLGGGNFWRGRKDSPLDKITSDQIGMISTIMNALTLFDAFCKKGINPCVLSAIPISIIETYSIDAAMSCFDEKQIVIVACGTGAPGCTSDTAASLRGKELQADIILKATNIDGVYNNDPKTHKDARKYKTIKFAKILDDQLGVIDASAAIMCQENNLKYMVFNVFEPNCFIRIVNGENLGTIIAP